MSHELPSPPNDLLGVSGRAAAEAPVTTPGPAVAAEDDPPPGEPRPFDPGEEVEEAVSALALRAHAAGLELLCRLSPALPSRVVGSPVWLRQVLARLLANAIQFTEKGEVVAEAEPALAPSAAGECWLHLAVRDTGIGVAPERQQLLLTPEAPDRPPGHGLLQAMRLIRGLGGRLEIDSAPGQGSTFRFTARFGVADCPPPPPPPSHLAGRSVLFADDNYAARRLLSDLAAGWGVKATVVEGGQAALQALQRAACGGGGFEALVIDTRMPPPAGFAVAERLRELPSLPPLPVVLLAPPPCRKGDDAAAVRLAIAARVSKPIRRGELLRALAAVLAPQPAAAGRL